jgi:hypothetical protein
LSLKKLAFLALLALAFFNPCKTLGADPRNANRPENESRGCAFLKCNTGSNEFLWVLDCLAEVCSEIRLRGRINTSTDDPDFCGKRIRTIPNYVNDSIGLICFQGPPNKIGLSVFSPKKHDLEHLFEGQEISEGFRIVSSDSNDFFSDWRLRFNDKCGQGVSRATLGVNLLNHFPEIESGIFVDKERGCDGPIKILSGLNFADEFHSITTNQEAISADPNGLAVLNSNYDSSAAQGWREYYAESNQETSVMTGTDDDLDISEDGKEWFHLRGDHCRKQLPLWRANFTPHLAVQQSSKHDRPAPLPWRGMALCESDADDRNCRRQRTK